jgi:hypothetical protein
MSQNILIQVINHNKQRYETIGDWQFLGESTLSIKVSNLGNDLEGTKFNCLVAVHELIEALLCKFAVPEITSTQVDEFDIEFERQRKEGDTSEPGNDPRAPYHFQHLSATIIEKYFAIALGVSWDEYEKRVNSL